MVCGLFSSFDPSVFNFYGLGFIPMKWFVSLVFLFFFLKWRVFFCVSCLDLFDKKLVFFFLGLVRQSMGKEKLLKVGLIVYSVFFFFIFSNLLGLLPFFFSVSSHLSVNLSVSLVFWLGGLFASLKKSLDSFLSHMVPFGSPEFLLPLLVLIETISLFIRPFTLSIRLMANIMAGHLIVCLIGGFGSKLGLVFFFPLFFEVGFLFFEVCISLVQAYVFSILLVMYLSD